jgi:hypothetical protein
MQLDGRQSRHFGLKGMTPMKASPAAWACPRLCCLTLSGAVVLASLIGGCGPSENKIVLTPEAKKAVMSSKVGDPSKFVKPKGARANRR